LLCSTAELRAHLHAQQRPYCWPCLYLLVAPASTSGCQLLSGCWSKPLSKALLEGRPVEETGPSLAGPVTGTGVAVPARCTLGAGLLFVCCCSTVGGSTLRPVKAVCGKSGGVGAAAAAAVICVLVIPVGAVEVPVKGQQHAHEPWVHATLQAARGCCRAQRAMWTAMWSNADT
jgi:hypothetical protein